MATRIDPNLMFEVKQYGAVGIEKCFNCGNCTAICSLASDEYPFPRNMIRMVQIGNRDQLKQHIDPWLCYYCGECSDTCPKGAEPGETMMSMRRWLTAQYDWTGLAGKFYTSLSWEIGSMILLGLLVLTSVALFHGPIVIDRVELNTFAPLHIVHLADWIMAGILVFFITTNVWRMFSFTMRSNNNAHIPLSIYFSEAWRLILHALTQRRWIDCGEDEKEQEKRKENTTTWISHLLMVSGYGLMLVLIIFFLQWFQTDEIYPVYHPQRWLGYYATAVILWGAGRAIWGRIKKEVQLHRFSHPSDWIFPILLFTVALTGILMHTFRYIGLAWPTYITYAIHLAFTAPMLILEVPFGKWSHLYYRPLAIFFQSVIAKANEQSSIPAGEYSTAD